MRGMNDRPTDAAVAPLSPAQRGLWLINELHPNSSLYNEFCSFRITGPLDLSALRAALQAVVSRHEALRTTFPATDGLPRQRVADHLGVPLPVTDLAAVVKADRPERVRQFIQEWSEQPFDLASGPLLRTHLVRLGEREHVLCFALHHIICDGQSMTVLFDDLSLLYAGAVIPPLPAQYRDYVTWRETHAGRDGEIPWWRSYLSGAPQVLTVPADRPRPSVRGTPGATKLFRLPGALMADAAALARRVRISPFMLLLGAYAALLGRLSGVDDMLVGVPFSMRPLPEFEPLIGLCVDHLPVRVRVPADGTFEQVLRGVRRSVLDVLAHQDVSFDQLVEELRPDRGPGHTPLVQVSFSADMKPFPQPRFPGLGVELIMPEPATAKFDLDMSISEAADGPSDFIGALTYSTELFERDTADHLVDQFQRVLAAAVAGPGRRLSTLPLTSDYERAVILDQWSHGGPARAAEPLVHELFVRQAMTIPNAPALSADGGEVSYADLNIRSDLIGQNLSIAGIGPEDIVGVLQERSADLCATLLGILKAGAAYLPLTTTHPPAYLALLLKSAGARCVVAGPALAHRLADADVPVLRLDQLMCSAEPAPPPARPACPDNLAYVLYTSGSTGEPKGVAVTHRSVSNLVATMREIYGLTPADRVLQFASIGFDIAVEEMFPTWAAGGCVVLTPEPPPDPAGLARLLTREQVTVAILTSSSWKHWVTGTMPAGMDPAPTLRLISTGAEPVDAQFLRAWQHQTNVPVFIGYGLTETTVNATVATPDASFTGDRVPVGRPISGADVYILDTALSPVPAGVSGEIYVGGDCLARGYLHRPGLTAARFVPHPFSAAPGARLLRTGDLGRWRPDGSLEMLGRLGDQVKIRGYRVEPAHIEAALCAHPGVKAAAVAVRRGPDGQDRLVGYVVPATGTEVPADLRGHLAGRLPVYLVPSALAAIAEIPLNTNGKLDRRALPEPADHPAEHVPARTQLERRLLAIWQEVLHNPAIGIHDNFFDCGGTSLTLASLLPRLNEELGRKLALVALYEFPTIASLASHLVASERDHPADGEGDDRAEQLRAGRARMADRLRARR